jgi:hypothetical protein
MDLCHGGSTFADRAAHTLHRAGAHVADCKYARHARLKGSGQVARGPACGRLTRQHEATRVERHATAFEPAGLGLRTHEEKHMAYRLFLLDAFLVVAPAHGGKASRQI